MAKYVDVDKVRIPKGFFNDLNVPKLLDWLNSQPTADVVEVVRCKECQYLCRKERRCLCTKAQNFIGNTALEVYENHFCGYGKRRCSG